MYIFYNSHGYQSVSSNFATIPAEVKSEIARFWYIINFARIHFPSKKFGRLSQNPDLVGVSARIQTWLVFFTFRIENHYNTLQALKCIKKKETNLLNSYNFFLLSQYNCFYIIRFRLFA